MNIATCLQCVPFTAFLSLLVYKATYVFRRAASVLNSYGKLDTSFYAAVMNTYIEMNGWLCTVLTCKNDEFIVLSVSVIYLHT